MTKEPAALGLHPAIEEIGIDVLVPELISNALEQAVLITSKGVLLAGFNRWRSAITEKIPNLLCVEYELADIDVLPSILALQQEHTSWKAFTRIRLALQLEAALQARALENMRMGGRQKGLAILPKADQIDIREQIAEIAGVGARNVSKVKEILTNGHCRIIEELMCGSLSINQGHLLSQLPRAEQVEALANKFCGRAYRKIEQSLLKGAEANQSLLNALPVLKTLQEHELAHPGSVSIRLSRGKRTVVTLGEDLHALFVKNISHGNHEISTSAQTNFVPES